MTVQLEKYKAEAINLFNRLKLVKTQKTPAETEQAKAFKQLTEVIDEAYNEWQNALANYETAENKELIDYYAYRIKASEIRYDYFLKLAKEASAANKPIEANFVIEANKAIDNLEANSAKVQ